MWSNWDSHLLLVGIQNDTTNLENHMAVSQNVEHSPTAIHSLSTPK